MSAIQRVSLARPRLRPVCFVAKKAAINLNGHSNGVSLSTDYHRLKSGTGGDVNALQRWYYEEVEKRFMGVSEHSEFISRLDELSEWLLE